MEFSYVIEGRPFLENIKIDLSDDRLIVITGIENTAFEIMGGVIAGLFPVKKEENFSQLEEIVKYFSGEVIIHSGNLPKSGLYLGPDPDKHILFSKVKEEVFAQLGFQIDPVRVLNRFGLDASFINRKIMTLSGGEKVKVALSILFSKETDCIVLHGVLPWLDVNGKEILKNEIMESLNKGVKVIILEQEVDDFDDLYTNFYYFDGKTINKSNKKDILGHKKSLLNIISKVRKDVTSINSSDSMLDFKNVYFDYYPSKNNNLLLNNISFTFFNSRIYGLTGENGSGKSTIAKLITRILVPIKGDITFGNRDLKKISRNEIIKNICYVGQFPERQLVYGDIDQYRRKSKDIKNDLSINLLNKFFNTKSSYPISTLNPLQLKFLLLFSSISNDTKLIILDEPTWGVDINGQMEIAEVIGYLTKNIDGLTILLISHDREFLNEFSTNMLTLNKGKINELN